ncbi:MAG: hypothetical protein M1834_009647 [Cirrosporium novae-zelandiae]|nr:MAG: hypothetical protein M1834_009647 [Cirrosporium novae-zelandiae]
MTTAISVGIPVPKMLPITSTWTLPFAVYMAYLSNTVVYHRLKNAKYTGDRLNDSASSDELGNDRLFQACRSYANFTEKVPFALVLTGFAELNGANRKALSWILGVLLALQIAHSEFGLKRKDSIGIGRPIAYYGTEGIVAGLAVYGAYLVKGYWGL